MAWCLGGGGGHESCEQANRSESEVVFFVGDGSRNENSRDVTFFPKRLFFFLRHTPTI